MAIVVTTNNELYHFGIKRRSGRYPWGSGDRPYQSEEQKRERKAQRKEKIKKVAATAGKVAKTTLKIVAKTAITSALLSGVAAVGIAFLDSPIFEDIVRRIQINNLKGSENILDRGQGYIMEFMQNAERDMTRSAMRRR